MKKSRGYERYAESAEAAQELRRIREMSWTGAKQRRALDLAISLLEARALDAEAEED